MQSMIVKGVSDGRFTWRDVEPRKSTAPRYTKTFPSTYEEADIYSEAWGSENVKKEEEVENTCEKAKAARDMQSQKMTHDISNSICSV